MPCSSNPSRKRQRQEPQPPNTSRHQSKRQKPNEPTAYWDNLSKIWLTSDALKELDHRNSYLRQQPQKHHRPITRQLHTQLKKCCEPFQFAPEFLHNCAPSCLAQVKRLSRLGGPDLSDLRNVCNYEPRNEYQSMLTTLSIPDLKSSIDQWAQVNPVPAAESGVQDLLPHQNNREMPKAPQTPRTPQVLRPTIGTFNRI